MQFKNYFMWSIHCKFNFSTKIDTQHFNSVRYSHFDCFKGLPFLSKWINWRQQSLLQVSFIITWVCMDSPHGAHSISILEFCWNSVHLQFFKEVIMLFRCYFDWLLLLHRVCSFLDLTVVCFIELFLGCWSAVLLIRILLLLLLFILLLVFLLISITT